MSKKIFVAVLAVALLGAAVGVGIHILHRDALAVATIFQVVLQDNGEPVQVNQVNAIMYRSDGEVLEEPAMNYIGSGIYKVAVENLNSQAVTWGIEAVLGGWEPEDPPDNPWTVGNITHGGLNDAGIWELQFP